MNYQGSIIAQAVMEYKGRARKILIDGLVKVRLVICQGLDVSDTGYTLMKTSF